MIKLEQAATFLEVARCGSFREAALRTGLSQPAVTQHVKRLEQELRVSLIERGNAGSRLTPQGRAFLPFAASLVRTATRAKALFSRDKLVVGASSNIGTYLLPPFLKAYQAESAHGLDVVIADNVAIVEQLASLSIDVALTEWWDHRPGFVASTWRREELVLIVPPGHHWAKRDGVPLSALKGMPLLGGESGTGTGRLLRNLLGADADGIRTSMQLGSTEAVKHAVRAGMGISIVMASAVEDEHRSGRLCAVRIEQEKPCKELFIVRPESSLEDSLPARFMRFVQQAAPAGQAGK